MSLAKKLAQAARPRNSNRTWINDLTATNRDALFELRRMHKLRRMNLMALYEEFALTSKVICSERSWFRFFRDDGRMYPEPEVRRGKKR